jgi:hypothetical protein
MNFFRTSFGIFLLLTAALGLFAQPSAAPQSTVQMEGQWNQIRQYEFTPPAKSANQSASTNTLTGSAVSIANASIAANYVQRADEINGFQTQNPDSPHASEARRLEALMLVYARYNGMDSVKDRCDARVLEVRRDKTLPEEARFQLASLADLRAERLSGASTQADLLAAFEKTTRSLILEFPHATSAYESLLHVADDAVDDAVATRIAADLLKMPAPQSVRDRAQRLLDRYALVGQPLTPLLGTALAASLPAGIPKGHMTVIYTWSAASEGVFLGHQIATVAPSDATIIGINVDTGGANARKAAQDNHLPGIQIVGSVGLIPRFADQLHLIGHDFVIVADRMGTITSVSGRVGLAAKISAANK